MFARDIGVRLASALLTMGLLASTGCGGRLDSGIEGDAKAPGPPGADGGSETGAPSDAGPEPDQSPVPDNCGDGICDRKEDCRSCRADCGYCCPLPESYACETFHFPEAADGIICSGADNSTAKIAAVHLAQTHVLSPNWPLFFLIASRPALLTVTVHGEGASPQVKVTGSIDGESIGELCLAGPDTLDNSTDASRPSRTDRFSVTLPKSWLQPGLSLAITAGPDTASFDEGVLRVGHAPELNLVMVPFDILNNNDGKPDLEAPDAFLGNLAGAIPAARINFAHFPGRISLPEMVVSRGDTVALPVRITKRQCANGETPGALCEDHGIPAGNINAVALRFLDALKRATGDYPYSVYYGNTEHFFPGGWGGGKAFVGADFGGVLIHELGHALSLPHWGSAYNHPDANKDQYNYPYGGINNADGGGRGDSWNYYQNISEFVSPLCEVPGHELFGKERSDAMQRSNHCVELRSDGKGPWDGFGDFSAISIFRMLTGGEALRGQVPYRQIGGDADFQVREHSGWPNLVRAANGARALVRSAFQRTDKTREERFDFLHPQAWDVPVYTVLGTYHPQGAANGLNVIYTPIKYVGTLPAILDPTVQQTFDKLAAAKEYEDYFWGEKDLTFKFIYQDGSTRFALYPYDGVSRSWAMADHPWRWDLLYFAINIPADKDLKRIELYERPFCVRHANIDVAGNIANPNLNITPQNFMQGATLVASRNL